MELFRITRIKYLENFTGKGGSFKNGARWNSPGLPVLYFASTPSVALLEMANYLPNPRLVPTDYGLGIYHLPDEISKQILKIEQLPTDWSQYPYPASTQNIGSEWLTNNTSLILVVPSVAVPAGMENIIVVNPLHPEIVSLKLVSVESSLYNQRAFKGLTDI
jgi:RES domain-containing protein